MPTALEMLMSGTVSGRELDPPTATALKALNEGKTVVVAVTMLEKIALHMECMNPGKLFEELVHVDMDEIEQKFLVTLVKKGECPAQKPKGAHGIAKWEMPLRNHETNHLGKGPSNKFGGFN
ncbi:hypothetical protein [Pseudomonas phage vB_PaeP_PS28]|nr:hypothetical protein [Pseudomonas phage vB_PaeP_PS28]